MKRDWNLIKQILEAVQDDCIQRLWKDLDEKGQDAFVLHCHLLQESGLLINFSTIQKFISDDSDEFREIAVFGFPSMRLTMAGYDMLVALNNDNVWSRLCQSAK